jgi:hypothetical protein
MSLRHFPSENVIVAGSHGMAGSNSTTTARTDSALRDLDTCWTTLRYIKAATHLHARTHQGEAAAARIYSSASARAASLVFRLALRSS